MSFRQLWEGGSGDSFITRLDGRTKLCILFLFAVLMILADNPRTLFILFSVSVALHGLAGTPSYKWRALCLFMLLALWGSVASQALFFAQYPKTPLVTLIPPTFPVLGPLTDGLYIYREGIIYGAVQGMRSAALLSMGLLLCWTSDPRELLRGLTSWRLSPQAAFMLVTAIRFFPVLAAEAGEVLVALRLRSGKNAGHRAGIRYLPYMIKPLLTRCLRRSQTLALSVVSRGLFLAGKQSASPWDFREKAVCFLFLLFVLAAGAGKILYALAGEGLYIGAFRTLYDWTKLYL